jgi:hypothetical protein
MPSERVQRRIDGFLDRAEQAAEALEWRTVSETAAAVLAIDPLNEDAQAFLQMSDGAQAAANRQAATAPPSADIIAEPPAAGLPASFASGRYAVRGFLGRTRCSPGLIERTAHPTPARPPTLRATTSPSSCATTSSHAQFNLWNVLVDESLRH